jgi:hypothetical protein
VYGTGAVAQTAGENVRNSEAISLTASALAQLAADGGGKNSAGRDFLASFDACQKKFNEW